MTELLEEPQALEPVDDWSDVDPDYESILPDDDEQDDIVEDPSELDEDLTEEEIEVPDDLAELLPFWVSYELHGRNLDAETTWALLATEDFDGDLEVEVDGLTAGARWEFRVRLIDRDGRHSRFSEPLQIDLPTDFTPPPAPTEPIVRNVRGYTAVGWDGLLQGPIPGDMSHVQLYVQQQHPDGDTDGEPGDPRRITTMSTAGEHPLLQFLANVLHKAWFTAVDTTGNESPWSPQVEFTPTPPVDEDAINAELEDARGRITEADERLTAGQQALTGHLDDLNENRLPALRDRLDTIEPVIEDYDDRIQAAQDGAESARDTAEDLRDNVLPPLSADLSDLTENRLPAVEGTLDTTRLGMENLRDIRLPELQDALNSGLEDANEWREVGAISAESLRVGSWQDMIPDPAFSSTWWRFTGSHSIVPSYTRDGVTKGPVVVLSSAGSAMRTQRFKAIPGASYVLEFEHERSGSATGADYEVFVGGLDSAGGWVGPLLPHTVRNYASTAWGKESLSFTIPETLEGLDQWEVVWRTNAAPSATIRIVNPSLRRKVDSQVIVDGSIAARHIMAEEVAGAVGQFLQLTADQIDTENLAAYLATIIELDAGQITAGKINTARLDAQEVAGAVANFLTLDALEINVEELAGQIANIVEVTAESIGAGAISTRHLSIGDFENFFPQQAVEDLFENGDNESPWSRIRGTADRWFTNTGQGRGMRSIRINDGTSSDVRTTVEFRPGGRGTPVAPGEELRLTWYGWAGGSGSAPYTGLLLRDESGSFVGRERAQWSSGWNEYVVEYTATSHGYVMAEFDVDAGAAMRGHMQDFRLRRKTGGELLVDGSVTSRSVDTEEFFAAEAVIQKIWTDIVRSRLIESQGIITEDMIATGAITTPKLTVTEEMVGEVAKLLRIEAGSLASNDIEAMRIVSSLIEATTYLIHDSNGDVSVRLDGVDNYLAGRLQAGMSENSSISLDYGEKVRFSGLNEEGEPDPQRVISTPYLNFHTTNVTYQENQEPSIHLERGSDNADGMMIINPGYTVGTDAFRAKLNVVGDVRSNRLEAREWSSANYGFSIPSDDPNLTTTLGRESGGNTYLLGPHHIANQARGQTSFWSSSQYQLASGGLRRRVFTWGAPPPTGTRRPITSVHISQASSDRNAYVVANTSHISSTGYSLNEYNPSSGSANYWIYQLAVWEG